MSQSAVLDQTLAVLSGLRARLSRSSKDIIAAQKLRHEVFYEEMGAATTSPAQIDSDPYDAICDHLIVEDTSLPKNEQVIGTYRLLLQGHFGQNAQAPNQFYSQSEFDIEALLCRKPDLKFLELGRSCVKAEYRNKRTIELLWATIWAYARANQVDVMFGCASFEGTDPQAHAEALSFLYHYRRAVDDWQVDGFAGKCCEIDLMAKDKIQMKRALRAMPPLVKGYIRLGAMVGSHAFVDHLFATTDVMIILPVSHINPKYITYYGADASRHTA